MEFLRKNAVFIYAVLLILGGDYAISSRYRHSHLHPGETVTEAQPCAPCVCRCEPPLAVKVTSSNVESSVSRSPVQPSTSKDEVGKSAGLAAATTLVSNSNSLGSARSVELEKARFHSPFPASPDLNNFLLHILSSIYAHQLLYSPKVKDKVGHSVRVFTRMLRWMLTGGTFDCSSPKHRGCLQSKLIGSGYPGVGYTMVGWLRLDNLENLVPVIINEDIPGDIVETGSWRGGASIFMRLLLDLYSAVPTVSGGVKPPARNRTVFICDSFQGLPKPREINILGDGDYVGVDYLSVPVELVRDSVSLWTSSKGIELVKGFFVNTMPPLRERFVKENRHISILRLDGDMYESTMDVLFTMYDLVSPNGFIIIDDWGWKGTGRHWAAKIAVVHFKVLHGIWDERMIDIDGSGAYWRKTRDVKVLYRDKITNGSFKEIMKLGEAKVKEMGLKAEVDY